MPLDESAGIPPFPHVMRVPRTAVECTFDLRHWAEMDRGGHLAAMEQPEALVDDIRSFVRPLR